MNREQFKRRVDDHQGHFILPDQLRVGMYVHLDLGWMDHPFTFSNFKIKDEGQISQILAMKLDKIRYDPMRSDVLPEFPKTIQLGPSPIFFESTPAEPPAPLQRSARLNQLNEAILVSEQQFSSSSKTAYEAVHGLSEHPAHAIKIAETLVNEMVNSVITESDVVLHAIGGGQNNRIAFVHPINVTVLALMLAKSLDMKEAEAAELGVAALFHDAGKEESPQNKSFVDLHCEMGARLALRAGMSERIFRIILQHHEYMDGSGYPMHLKGDRIDPLARVLSLVNHFDNLCNPPNPADAMTPYEALGKMYAGQSQKFDAALIQMLIKLLGVYPPGSVVQLSNGMYGMVLTANPSRPLQPLVMAYVAEVARETPVVIDLGQETDITIRKCLRPDQLPKDVFDYLRPSKRMSFYFLRKETVPSDRDDLPLDQARSLEQRRA